MILNAIATPAGREVRAGAEFKDGKPVERPDESGGKDQAA
jgi:hypothetical protein